MFDDDDFYVWLSLITLVSAAIFTATQGRICTAMPVDWFIGLVSGITFSVCTWLLLHRRE